MGIEEVTSGQTQTEPQSLPDGWARTTIGDILTLEYGKSLVKANRAESGEYPVYGSSGVVGFHTEHLIKQPAIIVGRKGAAGAVHLCKKDFWPIDTTYFVKVNNSLSTDFIFYLLKFCRLQKYESSTAIPGLNRDHAYAEKISLPPLAEQQRIVAKIEELFSELDKGVENLRTAQQQLKVYRQTLLKHAFEGKLTADSTFAVTDCTWPKHKLGELLDFLTSGSRGWAAYYADAGDIFIRAQNIKHDRLELSDIAFVALPDRAEGLRTRVQQDDLLITITGANVTKSALVEHAIGTAYVSQHVALCRPTNKILPKFLYWFVVAEAAGRKQLTDLAYGAGKPGLNLENIRSITIHLPELAEQAKVVELIEDKLSVIENLEQTITHSLQQAEVLRQSILKRAFSSQLVAQDANDEPASVLLERIKAEKQTKSAAGKRTQPAPVALPNNVVPMPARIPGIASTDLHAGILALAYSAHEAEPKYLAYFGHVKGEKVSHLVEAHLGIELDRAPVKDAAGPNDYPHLKKVESRARKVGWFDMRREPGATAYSLHKLAGFNELQTKTRKALGSRLSDVEALLRLLLPLNTRQAEIVATLYAAWNNLLLAGQQPSDQQIIFEARDNWHPDKLKIEQERFEKGLSWMKAKGLVPNGQGRPVKSKPA